MNRKEYCKKKFYKKALNIRNMKTRMINIGDKYYYQYKIKPFMLFYSTPYPRNGYNTKEECKNCLDNFVKEINKDLEILLQAKISAIENGKPKKSKKKSLRFSKKKTVKEIKNT